MKRIEFIGGISKELAAILEENEIECTCIEGNICELTEGDYDALREATPEAFAGGDILDVTYDVQFDDDTSCDRKDFRSSYDECLDYIKRYNGTDESYFADYRGGVVSIVRNETEETVYEENIPVA